ncbi:hypothetical protein DSO57_1000080 [Entomophthora muscae]|uniref:Uncharacterized protein n=1 Tax=Entomophthora muscae TaxID=34485 RepID=A0ACC2SN08_9FUNG|nr:hypothetical protein DSO57_1000080 [Entomophthora muscae]
MLKFRFCLSVLLAGVYQAYITDVPDDPTYTTDLFEESSYVAEVPEDDTSGVQCFAGKQCFGEIRKYTIQAPDKQYKFIASDPQVTQSTLLDPKMYLPEGLAFEAGVKYVLRTFSKNVTLPCPPRATPSDEAQGPSGKCPGSDGGYITSADASCPGNSSPSGYITTVPEDTQESGYRTHVPDIPSKGGNTPPKVQEHHTLPPKNESNPSTLPENLLAAEFPQNNSTLPSKAEENQPDAREDVIEEPVDLSEDLHDDSDPQGDPQVKQPATSDDDGVQPEDKKEEDIPPDNDNQPDDQSNADPKVTHEDVEPGKEDAEASNLIHRKVDSEKEISPPQQVTSQKDIPVSLLDHQELICPDDTIHIHIKDNQHMCSSKKMIGVVDVDYILYSHQELVCPDDTVTFTSPNPCLSEDKSTGYGAISLSEGQCPEDFTQLKKDISSCLPSTINAVSDEILYPKPGQNVACQRDYSPVTLQNGTRCVLDPQTIDGSDLEVHEMRPQDKLDCPRIFPAEDLISDGLIKKSQCGGKPKSIVGGTPDAPYPRDFDQFSCGEGSYINEIVKYGIKTRECRKKSIVLWTAGREYPKSKEMVLTCPKDHELQSEGGVEWCAPTGPEFYMTPNDCDEDSDFVANYSALTSSYLKPIYALPNVVHNINNSEEAFICPDGYEDIQGDALTKYLQSHSALHWVKFAE